MSLFSRIRAVLALVVAVLAVATACGSDDDSSSRENGATLSVAEFADALEGDVVILDVRTPEEYAAGHIEGAKLVDVSSPDFAAQVGALDEEATYAVYCRSGNRSAQAVEIMLDLGFTDVFHLGGGITAWTADGRPVTV